MPIAEGLDAGHVPLVLERRRQAYEATKNPMHAWGAYEEARMFGVAVPSWVLKYFDLVAATLPFAVLDDQRPSTTPGRRKDGAIQKQVCNALGFVPGGVETALTCYLFPDSNEASREKAGAFNPLDMSKSSRDQRISDRVRAFLKKGDSPSAAVLHTAESVGVSAKTVRRALKDYPA